MVNIDLKWVRMVEKCFAIRDDDVPQKLESTYKRDVYIYI